MAQVNTMPTIATDLENVLGSNSQEAEHLGDVPFVDGTAPITTGNEIVAFSTVESPIIETVPESKAMDENVVSNMLEGRDHSVIDILSREYAFADFTIPIGGTAGQILQSWKLLDVFLSQPNVLDKVSGFAFLKTDLLLRLEFTTLPTVSGGVMLSFYPDLEPTQLGNRTGSRLQLSQVPNIQQSLTTAVSMKMKVPWISAFYGRDVANGFGDIGTVILSRLVPSAINQVSVRAYISADRDSLHIQYPTTAEPSIAPSLLMSETRKRVLRLLEMGVDHAEIVKQILPQTQSNRTKPREAQAMKKKGVISGILDTGSKIATVAQGIPVIGGVASAAAPLLKIGSALAGLLGLSKPQDDTPLVAVKWKPAASHLTSEGTTLSHQYTIHEGASVTTTDANFGSNIDEMAIEAIMRSPNIIADFNVSTSMPARYVLYQKPLNLMHIERVGAEIDNACLLTHQAWIASLCNNWNAKLNFDFDAYLTHFHRVKLRFIVLPNVFANNLVGAVLPATFDINKASSAVVEFTGDNVNWSIQIDTRSNTSMKLSPVPRSDSNFNSFITLLAQMNNVRTSYGTLLVMVEVPLQASAQVASNVNFVVNFSAEDVELSVPATGLMFLPRTQSASQSTLGTAFAKFSRSERMIRGADMLTSNSVPIDSNKNLETCAGDALFNLRNLLNAFTVFNPTVDVDVGQRANIRPSFRRSLADSAAQSIDLFDYLTKGYGFMKGGINLRLGLIPQQGAQPLGTCGFTALSPTWQSASSGYSSTSAINVSSGITVKPGTRVVPVAFSESPIDCSIPFYQPWHIIRTTVNNSMTNFDNYGASMDMNITFGAYQKVTLSTYRAVGDDFTMGFLMSLPSFRLADGAYIS
jgi:hypothetical protein